MSTSDNIFLVGPMAAGKSAVGRALARELGKRFVDSDEEIEARTGVDVAYIFEREGEAGFRERESRAIDELSAQTGIVMATGGGAVLREANRRVLSDRGTVVLLETTVDQQLKRTARTRHRPLLETSDPRAVLERLREEREPLYRSIADIVIETDGRKVAQVVRDLLNRLQEARP